MNKNIIGAMTALCLSAAMFVSCATGTVYFKGAKNYESAPLKVETDWDYANFSWNGYKLFSDENTAKITPDYGKYGMNDYATKSAVVNEFKKSGKKLFNVMILKGTKKISTSSFKGDNADTFIVTGPKGTKIKINEETNPVMLQDSSVIPVKVTRLTQILRDGKVYNMPGNSMAGVKVEINGQDYAVVDFVSESPAIYLNNNFDSSLTTEESDFAASLLLLLYEVNETYSGFFE